MNAVRLPWPLRASAERAVAEFLAPGDAPAVDFAAPVGEPALVPPESVSWRIFKNPTTLFIGGVTAVILELAEPRVRAGVWEHTSFRTDPAARLKRTGLAAMITVYGPRSAAEAMIRRVNARHATVFGVTESGEPYRADDPELLAWVQATAEFGFLAAYGAYAAPLAADDRDRLFAEGQTAARLYGAIDAPASEAELEALFARMAPRLEPSNVVMEFLGIMRAAPILPPLAGLLQPSLVKAAVAILPDWARERLKLGREFALGGAERALVRLAARAAERIVIESSPAAQACVRLGLSSDWLWRRE